ncbi:MAG TPA: TolC family protein [Gemmatimonadaceae bacterium]|jgi:outer membrane protein|nr:TolC family protein [Gemmatimonadaceae bacterium]
MRFPVSVALLALAGQLAAAQNPTSPPETSISLEQAIALARQNNPNYLGTLTGRRTADAAVRAAYGAFLPSLSSSFGASYQAAGSQVFQGLTFTGSSDAVTSRYNLGVSYSLSAASFMNPKLQKANRAATEANIVGQAEALRAGVTGAYLDALAARANATLQDTLVISSEGQLALAQAKMQTGQGTILDVNSAEVALGQARIAALTAHNDARIKVVTLYQQMGVPMPASPDDVTLTTTFNTTLPVFSLDSLLHLAEARNPAIDALRASQRAASVGVSTAKARYTPSLSLNTGWGGNTYEYTNSDYLVGRAQAGLMQAYGSCQINDSIRIRVGLTAYGCGSPTLSAAQASQIRSENSVFPFKFTSSPFSVSASLSLPIFDGFSREQGVQQAIAQKQSAEYQLKAQELQTRTQVTQALLNLELASRTIALREQNADKAREEYQFAQERYKVGQANYLDVTTAHATFVQAQVDRLTSIYDFQKAFAALESAVGRPLR